MASNEAYRLYDPSTDQHLLPSFAKIHADCIKHDGQALVLLPPLNDKKVLAYWREQHATLSSGKMIMILAFEPSASSGAATEEIAGFVCLGMPATETGPFRGEVTRLMVSIHYRRKGIARRLMDRLEVEAKKRGRTLLMLDTSVGGAAENIYPRLGYKEIGRIPKYATSPKTGDLMDEIFFYKDLRN